MVYVPAPAALTSDVTSAKAVYPDDSAIGPVSTCDAVTAV